MTLAGTGKTSIFNMLCGFIQDERVKLFYNAQSLRTIDKDFYNKVLQVEQKVITIHDTIRNNITFGDIYSEEAIQEVISVAQLETLVEKKGLDYVIAEGAANISGGECQRIGIARMLLRKPNLLLLDEPTSALDNNTSENLAAALHHYAKKYGISLLVISHKDEFIDKSDRVISLTKAKSNL